MRVNLENLVSITEANQNFSKIARMVDNKGAAVILKNNKPKYVLVEYDTLVNAEKNLAIADQETVDEIASSVLSRHLAAFKELAK